MSTRSKNGCYTYSDVVFGLFHLLGYQFSPHLADLDGMRFWRIDPTASYGILNGIARSRSDTTLITENWEDMLHVVGSLKLCTVDPSELMRTLQSGGRSSTVAKAIGEVGRIAKSLFLLSYIDDEACRRRILIQLNKGESRRSLARKVFYRNKGEVRRRYREEQEEQLSALGIVVNAIILWNTIYMERALEDMRQRGMTMLPEDVPASLPLAMSMSMCTGSTPFSFLSRSNRERFIHCVNWMKQKAWRGIKRSSDRPRRQRSASGLIVHFHSTILQRPTSRRFCFGVVHHR